MPERAAPTAIWSICAAFPAGDDYFLDGLRDTGLYSRDTFDYQVLEVYKGPASTLFGRGTTGGVINQVSKTPQLYPIMDFALTGGTNGEVRGTADINYLLNDLVDDTAAVRLNLMGQRNNFVGRNFARTQKWGAAPSLRLRPGHRHGVDPPVPARAGRQHSGLRASRFFSVRPRRSIIASLFPARRRPLQDRCRSRDGKSHPQIR